MKKGLTEIVFILDKSGSMSGLESDTIGGYNSMLEKQKKEEGEALFSTVLFDDGSTVLHDRETISDVAPITEKEYCVGGCTALLDAVGGAIRHISHTQKGLPEEEKPEKTLFIITTDGMENASKRYSYEKVKKMVEKKKEKKGWEFIFLGANIDAIDVANRFGVTTDRAVRYENDADGAELNYAVMSQLVSVARKASSPEDMSAHLVAENYLGCIQEDYDEYIAFSEMDTSEPNYKSVNVTKLEEALPDMPDRLREMTKMLYGLGGESRHTYEEVARAFHTSAGRVRQNEAKALRIASERD
jgi:uncharacterized protein YegL